MSRNAGRLAVECRQRLEENDSQEIIAQLSPEAKQLAFQLLAHWPTADILHQIACESYREPPGRLTEADERFALVKFMYLVGEIGQAIRSHQQVPPIRPTEVNDDPA